jgi:hypothetical protein
MTFQQFNKNGLAMKNLFALILTSIFSLTLLTQCSKEDLQKEFNTNFYTSDENGTMSLYIDDEYKGVLPYMAAAPECGADYGDGVPPLNFTLKTGSYKVTGKNEQGQVVSEHILCIRADGMGASGRMGGSRGDSKGDCLAVGLFK